MNIAEIKKLNWIKMDEWNDFPTSVDDGWGNFYVIESDVHNFLEIVFKDLARKLDIDISYSDFFEFMKLENAAFYSMCTTIFKKNKRLEPYDRFMESLKKMLRVPEVPLIIEKEDKLNADKVLKDFSLLSDEEKLEVLQRLKVVSIKVEFIAR